MAGLLLGLVTTYAAFWVALAVSLVVWAGEGHGITVALAGVAVIFGLMTGAVTFVIVAAPRLPSTWRDRLLRVPVVGGTLASVVTAPTDLLRSPSVVLQATLYQLAEIAFDALTLDVSLRSLGASLTVGAVLSSYVIASVASRVALAPLGLGTFEGGSVAMLHLAGVAIEPALAATLIFRGFTLWLPMLPGLWSTTRALRGANVPEPAPGHDRWE